jgi:hypothetical protein
MTIQYFICSAIAYLVIIVPAVISLYMLAYHKGIERGLQQKENSSGETTNTVQLQSETADYSTVKAVDHQTEQQRCVEDQMQRYSKEKIEYHVRLYLLYDYRLYTRINGLPLYDTTEEKERLLYFQDYHAREFSKLIGSAILLELGLPVNSS